ncbi:efflux RND transporter periplasmic adaptor subunit [Rhodobacteraceae bacterium CCMM004]|nr:efflux RND transporter periplasmic adaptor subunit [Rhodobacteraceae bacterium CCMM004]
MPSLRLLIFGGIGAAILIALGVVAFRTEPEPVDLATLARGELIGLVRADGTARVSNVYQITAPVTGTVSRISLQIGDPVVAGKTILASVEPADTPILDARSRAQAEAALEEARAALAAADAEVAAAEEELSYAQAQHDRVLKLLDRGLTTLVAVEASARAVHTAEAGAEAARSRRAMADGALHRAEATLAEPVPGGSCCRPLVSPIDGIVLDIEEASRRPVAAGAPLMAVGNATDLEIVADLLSSDAVQLPPEATAHVTRWGGPTPLAAQLKRVDPVARTDISALGIEEQRVDAVFDLLTPPEERAGLGHGYGVVLEIEIWRVDDAVILPLSATFRRDGDWTVFVEQDGRARVRTVDIGRMGQTKAEVLGGLDIGERVILHPNDRIADGVGVVARSDLR